MWGNGIVIDGGIERLNRTGIVRFDGLWSVELTEVVGVLHIVIFGLAGGLVVVVSIDGSSCNFWSVVWGGLGTPSLSE